MSVPLAVEGMDALAPAQEGERLCRENSMKAGGRSLKALSSIYSQLGNAYFVLRIFDRALEYHRHDLEIRTTKSSRRDLLLPFLDDRSGLAKAHENITNKIFYTSMVFIYQDPLQEYEAGALYNVASVYHCRAKTIIHASERLNKSGLLTASDMTATSQLQAAINCYLFRCMCRTYGNIGNNYYMLGDYATARLDIARQYGDRAAMRRAYTNLGNAHIFLSETAKALEYYRLALSVAAELHDEVTEAQCCFNVGNGTAICGDHVTAIEYHILYLKLARDLGDGAAESRACAVLATDFRKQGVAGKAVYFYALQGQISVEMGDQRNEGSVRNSLEDLLKSVKKWPIKEINDLEMDSSGDPEPHSALDLNASLKKLLCESELTVVSGVTRELLNVSQQLRFNLLPTTMIFFEMVSRLQSKRLNDQRCDTIILSDLTNHSKNVTRQSDTVASKARFGRRNRLSALFGRVGKAAKRQTLLMSASFFPSTTSTPRTDVSSMKRQLLGDSGDRFHNKSAICVSTSCSSSEDVAQNAIDGSDDAFMQPGTSRTLNRRDFGFRLHHLETELFYEPIFIYIYLCWLCIIDGAEGMLDLIASLQGRRMEEQRAHLNVQSEPISLPVSGEVEDSNDNVKQSTPSPSHLERSRSEDRGSLYEMVIRSSGIGWMNRTITVEDVSRMLCQCKNISKLNVLCSLQLHNIDQL
uniref:TPR_REGION domain-containing protein n=1 Tax=Wuchereria bancrofti TaxID=6293 RepID=A0AAF5PL15_WUCBA